MKTKGLTCVNFDCSAEKVSSWLYETALPLWSEIGIDRKHGGFIERLDLSGRPLDIGYKRTRITGRQLFVFCHAYQSGHQQYEPLIEQGLAFLLRFQKGNRAGEWRRSVSTAGEVFDDTIDLYDYAFVLFGLAWWYRISSDRKAWKLAIDTLQFIKAELRHPSGIGFVHERSAGEPYQQNPHMHLVEALIEWFDVTRDQIFYDELIHLISLFRNNFFFEGTLREYFNSAWLPVVAREGQIIEPGHMAEWAWILDRFSKLLNDSHADLSSKLMEFVKLCRQKNESGLIFDIVGPNFEVIKTSTRLWPQTEFIKGLIAEPSDTNDTLATIVESHINMIFSQFIEPAFKGGWLEHLDANGQPIVDYIPASSLYHLSLAFTEIIRVNEK